MPLNDNVDLMSTYFILFHSVRYSNCYQNIFPNSSFVKFIWFYCVIDLIIIIIDLIIIIIIDLIIIIITTTTTTLQQQQRQ